MCKIHCVQVLHRQLVAAAPETRNKVGQGKVQHRTPGAEKTHRGAGGGGDSFEGFVGKPAGPHRHHFRNSCNKFLFLPLGFSCCRAIEITPYLESEGSGVFRNPCGGARGSSSWLLGNHPTVVDAWLPDVHVWGSRSFGLAMSGDLVHAMGFKSVVLRFRRVLGPHFGVKHRFYKN